MAPKPAAQPRPKTEVGKLPAAVTSPVELGRLIAELEQVDELMLQLSLRHGGKGAKLPKTTRLMDQTVELNGVNLLQQDDRKALMKFFVESKAHAPVLHISFSAEPTSAFLEKLLEWLRREIHPLVLVTVGLQPTLGVGCVVRSTNKYFDFSLRQDFARKQALLLDMLAPKTPPKPVESLPAEAVPVTVKETVQA